VVTLASAIVPTSNELPYFLYMLTFPARQGTRTSS